MKTTDYVCNGCGARFDKVGTVFDGIKNREGCPLCGSDGFDKPPNTRISKNELRQYIFLKREIELCGIKLKNLEKESEAYHEMHELVENNRLRCMALLLKIQGFIYSIDDSLLRQIFEYRYVSGLKWSGVAARLGGYLSEDNVRIMHDRYLKSLETET